MVRRIRSAFPDAPSVALGVAAVRGGERFFELVALLGVVLYAYGFVTGHVDIALGVALGVSGVAGNLSLGFGRALLLDDG